MCSHVRTLHRAYKVSWIPGDFFTALHLAFLGLFCRVLSQSCQHEEAAMPRHVLFRFLVNIRLIRVEKQTPGDVEEGLVANVHAPGN